MSDAVMRPVWAGKAVTAFAPATVANVAVGFDLLGFSLDAPGDQVTLEPRNCVGGDTHPRVTVETVGPLASDVPLDPTKNTAAVALTRVLSLRDLNGCFHVRIEKGIPVGSGMGSSAASAVAAVVAANALADPPLTTRELLECAIAGEAVASGTAHADNVAPSLLGGLQLVLGCDPPEVVSLRVPEAVRCAVVHPRLRIDTRDARRILRPQIGLTEHVRQSALLAGFIVGTLTGDLDLIRRSMIDTLIEPQRTALVPGFAAARDAALGEGALGFSLSGSGPAVFAWAASAEVARHIGDAVRYVFREHGLESEVWLGQPGGASAHLIGVGDGEA